MNADLLELCSTVFGIAIAAFGLAIVRRDNGRGKRKSRRYDRAN